MKKLSVVFAAVLLLLCMSAFAAEPGYVLAPDAANPIEFSAMFAAVVEYTEDYATLVSTHDLEEGQNGDPYFIIKRELDTKYEWIKLRVRNRSEATMFEFHFASDGTKGNIVGESCTHFPISSGDTEFKEYIYNIKERNSITKDGAESVWTGTATQLRFDSMWIAEPSGQMPKGSTMDIDYIAFFETEEEAKAFTGPKVVVKEEKDYSDIEWDKNSPHFIFDNEDEISKWGTYQASSEIEMGNLKYTPTGKDPTLRRYFDTPFSADEFHYFAYRSKPVINASSTGGGVFFTSDKVTSLTSNFYHSYPIIKGNKWVDMVIDMENIQNGTWEGNIDSMRIDPLNGVIDLEDKIYINRLGFFRTEDEAYAFLADGRGEDFSGAARIDEDNFSVIIPGGTVEGEYVETDYTVSGEKSADTPLVTYVDKDGKESVVAMSYTNPQGYTYYVANKAGTYKYGANHKEYSDIAGHWGESYINFVSDRALFGGTSPTEFSPDQTMTRGMFITVLGRMHGLDTSKYDGNTGYADVPATEYYAPYIQWAKEIGIMAGTSDTAFSPEEPITRAAMAVVIKNYTDNSGFNFTVYKETEGFNDLAGLDEATVNAINAVKNVGIVGGKGEGRFDPNGISTRAEVATVMERTIKACLGVLPNAAVPKADFAKDRVAIGLWGVQGSLATPEGIKDMADLGANLIINGGAVVGAPQIERVLTYADLYGIEVYLGNYFDIYEYPTEESAKAIIEERDPRLVSGRYLHHPSFAGHYEGDEPGSDHFALLGDLIEDYESQMPGKRAFENLLPMYANAAQLKYGASASSIEYYDADPDLYKKHCQGWVDNVDTDYICTDIYPLQWTAGKKTTYRDYLESINQIASVAREAQREFWCCIQTFGWNEGQRTPNVAEYRWQTYCMFSFGCTGILLWNYMGYETFPSLVHPKTLEKTPAYYDCQVVMQEINAISDVYMQYKNLGAYTLNTTLPYQKMSNQYTDFATIKEVKTDAPVLIGCFDKKEGDGKAFTIVNLTDFQGNEGLVISTVSFALDDMSKTVTSYYHGTPTVLTAQNGMYTIDLEVGDGVFVTVE